MSGVKFSGFFIFVTLLAGGNVAQATINPVGNIKVHRYSFQAVGASSSGQNRGRAGSQDKCQQKTQISKLLEKYDFALRRYIDSKTKSVLVKSISRIKEGMTLSHLFPDYRDYRIFIRRRDLREIEVKDHSVQQNYYIWKEEDKIIMGADVMLMSSAAKNRVIARAARKARSSQWAADDYHRAGKKTRDVASSTAFKLDCQHTAELSGLVGKVTKDLMAQDDDRIISPRTFGRLLTILRAYISFNYYKDLSHEEFDQRFKQLGRAIGRGVWTHQKLTRLLGLHVLGRIDRNSAFRKTYGEAIAKAARRHTDVPRKWIEEIIWIETKGDPMTISRAGAYGLMQLMPLVYIGMGEEKSRTVPLSFARTINPFNASTNIERGAAFLSKLQQSLMPHMKGYNRAQQKKIIFHAYNTGVTRVIRLLKKHGLGYVRHLPGETKKYLDKLADFPGR